jgi:acetyl-CoA acyltransferase 2
MKNVYLIDGARTPFGTFGKSLSSVTPTELGVVSALSSLERARITPEQVDFSIYGNVIHSSSNAAYLPRHVAIKSGIPNHSPALLVNRLCGSGLQAVVSGAQSILMGDGEIGLVGGIENMSMSPHVNFTGRFIPQKFGKIEFEDMLQHTLTDQMINSGMGITAENLAEQYHITRKEQDEFSLLSHKRAILAQDTGRLLEEIVPIEIKGKRNKTIVKEDEHIKRDTSYENLAKLSPAFKRDGTVTAGNSSGLNDGAVSLVIASEDKSASINSQPLAKIVSWGITGVDPAYMGIGPVPAINRALFKANLTLNDMDLIEVNEAFAAQYLAVEKELGLDRSKTNVNGGAIALGHPVGASGARILLTLAYELRQRDLRYGLASLCIGGGQGIAMIIENLHR